MSEKLLPCPFCGHDTPEFERMGDRRQSCIVICGWCGARHESSDEGDRCGSSWNQRAEPSQDGLRTALETALARIEDMLADDDGQAFKEARKFLDATRPLSATPSAPTAVEPLASLIGQMKPLDPEIAKVMDGRWFELYSGSAPTAVEPKPDHHHAGKRLWCGCIPCEQKWKALIDGAPTAVEPTAEEASVVEPRDERVMAHELIKVAAWLLSPEPTRQIDRLEDQTHIGHRQFESAQEAMRETLRLKAMEIRKFVDALAALRSMPQGKDDESTRA